MALAIYLQSDRIRKQYAQFLIFLLLASPFITDVVSAKISSYQVHRTGLIPRIPGKAGGGTPTKSNLRPVLPSKHGIVVLHPAKVPPSIPNRQLVHLSNHNLIPKSKSVPNSFHLQQNLYPPDPTHSPMKKCNGRKNLVDDIGILSLITAVVASTIGLYTIVINSMTSNDIGIVSGLFSILIWLPSTVLTMWNLEGNLATTIGNYLNSLSFINSMYGFMGVIYGTADVVASMIGESIGIISFILSVVATFPEWLDAIIEYLYRVGDRRKLEYYVENYGCEVPGIFNLDGMGRPLYERINKFLTQETNMKGVYPLSG